MIASPAAVKGSMGTLLGGIGDLEWVFWCIDDRFPTGWIGRRRTVIPELGTLPDEVEEVKLLRWREPLLQARLAIGATDFRCQAAGQPGVRILAPPFRPGRVAPRGLPGAGASRLIA